MNTRTSKLIFPAILFLFACLTAFGENGPTPKVVVGSSGISDGSVTNAKLAEPVSVANGGTGKTTAAAGLAALGGASLNGSSTVDFACATATVKTVVVEPIGYSAGQGIRIRKANSSAAWWDTNVSADGNLLIFYNNAGLFTLNANGTFAIATTTIDPVNRLQVNGNIKALDVPTYADNAAATAGGLVVGAFYRTSTGVLMIRY
jgi:hypothetical protein